MPTAASASPISLYTDVKAMLSRHQCRQTKSAGVGNHDHRLGLSTLTRHKYSKETFVEMVLIKSLYPNDALIGSNTLWGDMGAVDDAGAPKKTSFKTAGCWTYVPTVCTTSVETRVSNRPGYFRA
jgi:hypothetical protein